MIGITNTTTAMADTDIDATSITTPTRSAQYVHVYVC
jgi:hypothetical protein